MQALQRNDRTAMNFQQFIAKLFRISPPPHYKVETRESFKLTLDEWRKNEQLVLESRALAKHPTYRSQMDILRNAHPVHMVMPSIGVSPTDRIVQNAKCEGYEMAVNNLEAMAKPFKHQKPLEATFSDPEYKEQLKRK